MYLIREYDNIKNIVMNKKEYDGFVIDPCGCNMAIQKSLIQNIEKASNPEVLIKPEKVQTEGNVGLKQVYNPPENLKNALLDYFKSQDNISKVYYMETVRRAKLLKHLFLLLNFARKVILRLL